ncbi:hypothetical protein [Ammoniphilus oxalaticus]|nr:hypothetical protein [Ammoniphilus oxalaticus]
MMQFIDTDTLESLEVARNAIREGLEAEVIAKLTGFSKSEIEKIAEDMEN